MSNNETPVVGKRFTEPPLRIAVVVPTRGTNPSGFTEDFGKMLMYSASTLVAKGIANIGIVMHGHTYVDQGRTQLATKALTDGATHLLWLDDDMRFPYDALTMLLSRNVDIVGANYSTRRLPAVPTAIRVRGNGSAPRAKLYPSKVDEALTPVDALGFGCVLIRAKVFDQIDHPWFRQYFDDARGVWVGEDVHFCAEAQKAGYIIWVDTELSNEVRHVGAWEFSLDQAAELRDKGVLLNGD